MENENKTYYYAINTSEGIGILAESQEDIDKSIFKDAWETWGSVTPEVAIDHLKKEMLLKASDLRAQAQIIMDKLKAFEELERISPPKSTFEATNELLPCNTCPVHPKEGCNCLESMDGSYK